MKQKKSNSSGVLARVAPAVRVAVVGTDVEVALGMLVALGGLGGATVQRLPCRMVSVSTPRQRTLSLPMLCCPALQHSGT